MSEMEQKATREIGIPALRFGRFRFTIEAQDRLLLPEYKGSTLRGGFGHAFRKVVCTQGPIPCQTCLLNAKCAYARFFETPVLGEPPPFMRGVKTGPRPFVLEPPLTEQTTYQPGEALSFELVLIGRATEYLPYFIHTFDQLGRIGIGRGKGKFHLAQVAVSGETWRTIYSRQSRVLRDYEASLVRSDARRVEPVSSEWRLTFQTPTRLRLNKKLVAEPTFREIVLSLLRRVCSLAHFHMPLAQVGWDWRESLRQTQDVRVVGGMLVWRDWQRYSNRQETRMKLGGFVGDLTLSGELTKWLPLLRLGEVVHLGKGATFGLGKYELRAVNGCRRSPAGEVATG